MKNGLIIEDDGTKCWYVDDQLHREDGPALEKPKNYRAWFKNGKLHREDGVAIEYFGRDGDLGVGWFPTKIWYYRGRRVDCSCQEEFDRLIRMRAFW
jgi:hypothetical protein